MMKITYMIRRAAIIAIIIFLLIDNSYLVIRDSDNEIFFSKINSGDKFNLSFMHSVSKSKVSEEYIINENLLIINSSTRYYDQGGAGLPDISDEIIIDTDGSFLVYNDTEYEKLMIYVDKNSNTVFEKNDVRLNLYQIEGKWMTYEILIEERNILACFYYKLKVWLNENKMDNIQ